MNFLALFYDIIAHHKGRTPRKHEGTRVSQPAPDEPEITGPSFLLTVTRRFHRVAFIQVLMRSVIGNPV